jgi:hypothetical protein
MNRAKAPVCWKKGIAFCQHLLNSIQLQLHLEYFCQYLKVTTGFGASVLGVGGLPEKFG